MLKEGWHAVKGGAEEEDECDELHCCLALGERAVTGSGISGKPKIRVPRCCRELCPSGAFLYESPTLATPTSSRLRSPPALRSPADSWRCALRLAIGSEDS